MSIAIHPPALGRRIQTWAERRALRARRDLAVGYQRALEDGLAPVRRHSARVPVRRDQVAAAAADLERLAGLLGDETRPLRAEGIVQAHALLCDSSGPFYSWAEPGTLRRRARVVCEELE